MVADLWQGCDQVRFEEDVLRLRKRLAVVAAAIFSTWTRNLLLIDAFLLSYLDMLLAV